MSGVEVDTPAFPVGADVETVDDVHDGRLDGPLYRVVGIQGVLRDVRRVEAATGELDGIELRFVAAELRPARPMTLRRHTAQLTRAAAARWRRAVADDDEDVDTLAVLVDSAESLADLVLDPATAPEDGGIAVCDFASDLDDAHVVQIDIAPSTGRVRVFINDGAVYDGDPETDEPPGAQYRGDGWSDGRRVWSVRSLMTGETSTFRATGQADAAAQYLDVVASNLMVWTDSDPAVGRCDECGSATEELVSLQHGPACSLHPDNCVGAQPGQSS
ncbi:hypothetical protein [Mycobacterium paragordonae]|uniref:hypothetical protein n=1 Tax=Mycobacterium paragordonae TaxID=1389713 RepID=UPI00105C5CBE|nr:hypothetical protein [Mycobacterium paragordonae]TDK96801.1 hypothetical protein EUA05_32080 [Mycobacterium paragordonae]